MVEAVVEFDYKAQEPDELSLKKGDVLNEIRTQTGGWWEGVLARTGKRGMFPDNFVRVIDLANPQADVPQLRKSQGRRCKVVFSYEPVNDDELELKVDDIIEVLAEVEEGWWKGNLRGKIGVFPCNFVNVINDDPKEASRRKSSTSSLDEPAKPVNAMNHDDSSALESDVPVLPPKPVKEMCRAIYPYDAVNDDELSLQKGDLVTLISRDGQDKGWWKGELKGKVGVFPDNFVQIIPTEEITKPARPPVKANNVTTNRVRDSITKPVATPSNVPLSQVVSAHRKSIELPPKPDEKLSPPGVSKKPVLPPPPLKKPVGSRSPSSSTVNKPLASNTPFPTESKQNATTPTKQPESPTTNVSAARLPLTNLTASLKQSTSSSDVQSSQVDTTKPSLLSGPKRSESTDSTDGLFLSRNSTSYSLSNHTSTETTEQFRSAAEVDLDCVSRTAMLTHPTASRVRAPRRRPPSAINTKESLEGGLMNGNVEPHFDNDKRASFVQELKMSQAKKNSSLVGTRVMIGTTNSSIESSTVIETTKISPGVTLRNLPVNMPRPHSMIGSGTSISPRGFQLPPTSPETLTISSRQFNELVEKISRLELQQESYQQAIKDLNNKLNEEVERRLQMQLELEKLTDLVTQV